MKKILLTGGSGLLSTNWAVLQRQDNEVVLGVHQKNIVLNGVRVAPIDLETEQAFADDLASIRPDVVIHTAALSNVELCEKQPTLAEHINVTLARNVAAACARCNVAMVQISTDHLFDGQSSFHSEADALSPLNVYSATKAAAEKAVLEVSPHSLIVRTNFFGWGTSYRKSFSDLIVSVLRSNQEIQLFDDVYYSPIMISRLVSAVHDLLNENAYGIFHIANDERISKYEFGIELARVFGLDTSLIRKASIKDRPELVQRPLDMSLSTQKVRSYLSRSMGNTIQQLEELLKQEETGVAAELQSV